MAAITQNQIAQHLGMPRTTVAAALNPRLAPRLRLEVRQRVSQAAIELGYVPHHAARRLARQRPDSRATNFDQVGLIYLDSLDDDMDPVSLTMLKSAEHVFADLDASLTFVRVSDSRDWEKVTRAARAGGVDGWLIYGPADDEVAERMTATGVPFVILGDQICTQSVANVNVDNRMLGRLAVEHLASLGHRRIGLLNGGMKHRYQRELREGFLDTIRELQLERDPRLIQINASVSNERDLDVRLLSEWFQQTSPTAIFAAEFEGAVETSRAFRQASVGVPAQVSIVGLEMNTRAASRENFTRTNLPMSEVGRQGAWLLHRLASGGMVETNHIVVAPSLSEGWSTCAPVEASEKSSRTNP